MVRKGRVAPLRGLAAGAIVALAGCAPSTTLRSPAPAPVWRGYVAATAERPLSSPRFAAPCVADVPAAFRSLERRGRALSFRPGSKRLGTPLWGHAQGIGRLSREEPTFVVSRSGAAEGALILRSGAAERSDIVATIPAPQGAEHAGGLALVGDLLVIPYAERSARSYVRLYDLGDPLRPLLLEDFRPDLAGRPLYRGQVSNAAAARLADGRLLLVTGSHSSRGLEFYVSGGERDGLPWRTWTHVASLYREIEPGLQTIALITQCDGELFLVGARNNRIPPPAFAQDRLRVYRLEGRADGAPRLSEIDAMHLFCESCNFAAGAAPWIGDDGRLTVYGIPHSDRDGVFTIEEFPQRK